MSASVPTHTGHGADDLVERLVRHSLERAARAREKFGPHPSAEFACCRLTEEVGELVQAATAMSKGRHIGRRDRMFDEAVDVVAMVLRLLCEFPDGIPSEIGR